MSKTSLSFSSLNKNDITIIKAVAIILIVFHNFIHHITSFGENELTIDTERILRYFDIISHNDIITFFNYTLSFLGHYGVQLFVFCSGYGLAKQYSKNPTSYTKYIIPRIVKIYALLIFALIIHAIISINQIEIKLLLYNAVWSLSMLKNLSFQRIFSFVGPWWYFSLAFQLYLIFPILYKLLKKGKSMQRCFLIILALSFLIIYILSPITAKYRIPLYGNFVGHLPEFLLGMYLALSSKTKLSIYAIIPALFVFILSNRYEYLFPFSFLSATIILIIACYPIFTYIKGKMFNVLTFIGSISMFMFVINGPLRTYTIPLFNTSPIMTFVGSFIHFFIVIIISFIMQIIYNRFINPYSNKLINKLTS